MSNLSEVISVIWILQITCKLPKEKMKISNVLVLYNLCQIQIFLLWLLHLNQVVEQYLRCIFIVKDGDLDTVIYTGISAFVSHDKHCPDNYKDQKYWAEGISINLAVTGLSV